MKEKIREVLEGIYGKNSIYVPILAEELEKKIPEWKKEEQEKKSRRDCKEEIRIRCWDFFAGGDTAEVAARRILEALDEPVS